MAAKKTPLCQKLFDPERHQVTAPELSKTVKKLMKMRRGNASFEHVSQVPGPSFQAAKDIINLAQQLLFPGFFAPRPVTELNIEYHTGQILYVFFEKLSREITTAIRHDCRRYDYDCTDCQERGREIAMEVTNGFPALREILITDVIATREGDPAAGDHYDQIIFCYPGLYATMVQRLAHQLNHLEVPFLPRILTEYAHARTGIDIHPGAHIGPSFFIDHGTGVVIGETTTIGSGVRLYQGVTLGALSLPRDAGVRLQGKKRHPTLEDGVTVYAGATILGGETVIGAGSVIGGNVWLTESVPPNTKVLLKTPELVVINGQSKTKKQGRPPAGIQAGRTATAKKSAPAAKSGQPKAKAKGAKAAAVPPKAAQPRGRTPKKPK